MASASKPISLVRNTVLYPDRVKDDPEFHSNKLLVSRIFPFLDERSLKRCYEVCHSWRIFQMANDALIRILRTYDNPLRMDRFTTTHIRTLLQDTYSAQQVPLLVVEKRDRSADLVEEDDSEIARLTSEIRTELAEVPSEQAQEIFSRASDDHSISSSMRDRLQREFFGESTASRGRGHFSPSGMWHRSAVTRSESGVVDHGDRKDEKDQKDEYDEKESPRRPRTISFAEYWAREVERVEQESVYAEVAAVMAVDEPEETPADEELVRQPHAHLEELDLDAPDHAPEAAPHHAHGVENFHPDWGALHDDEPIQLMNAGEDDLNIADQDLLDDQPDIITNCMERIRILVMSLRHLFN